MQTNSNKDFEHLKFSIIGNLIDESLNFLQHILDEITEEAEPVETPTMTTDETTEGGKRVRRRSVEMKSFFVNRTQRLLDTVFPNHFSKIFEKLINKFLRFQN